MTTDKRSTYLRQLMSRLLYSGVDGSDVGELVAEVSQHLEDTGGDPIAEFGPIPEFAVEVIAQRRVRKRAWLQRVALPWVAIALFAVGFAAVVGSPADGSVFVSVSEAVSRFAFVAGVVAGVTVMVRRQRGDSRVPPLVGIGVAAAVVAAGTLAAALIDPDLGVTLSNWQRWAVVAVSSVLCAGALAAARNPIRFPDSFAPGNLARSPLVNLLHKGAA